MKPIEARAAVAAPPETLYAHLVDLRDHWRLAGRWVDPVELRHDGGTVRLRGPLGAGRTVRTRLLVTVAPTRVAGEAAVGRTRASISWTLVPAGAGTLVSLRAELLETTPLDRLLLTFGGRAWLRRRFAATLRRLG